MKKQLVSTFASIVALICAATTAPVTAQAATSPRWGDVNSDGVVTVEDAQEILQYYATVVLAGNQWSGDFDLQVADVDLQEGVSVEDAQLVLQKYVAETLAAKTYLLPVEFSAEQTEDSRVLCTKESGWYVWSEKSNSVSSHIIDVVREGELFEILQKDESTSWYKVKMSSEKIGYMNISSGEFSNYFVIYTRKNNTTEPANQTTTETTTTQETTTTAATTSASETTTSEEVSTESKAETTTTSAATTTTTKATTESTSTTPETTTTTVSTTSKEETTTTTTTSETTVASTTTTVETTTAAQTTTSPFEEVPLETFEKGDVIEFTMTAWKVYDDTYEKVIAWAPNGTRFTIKEVHDLKGGDSKENQQVYLVEFEKQGESRNGYIFNAPKGFFKKVGTIVGEALQKEEVFEKFEVGDVIEFTMTSWKVYNGDFSVVLAWIQNGTRFTIEEVHNLSGGDSKVDQEVYYVSYEKDGRARHGYIFSGPIGYFKKVDSEK